MFLWLGTGSHLPQDDSRIGLIGETKSCHLPVTIPDSWKYLESAGGKPRALSLRMIGQRLSGYPNFTALTYGG